MRRSRYGNVCRMHVKVNSSMARNLPGKNQRLAVIYCSRVLLVAVDHNQLETMTSKTVDPIDWSYLPPSRAVPLEQLVHSISQCNLSPATFRMRDNHLAYSATQGKWRTRLNGEPLEEVNCFSTWDRKWQRMEVVKGLKIAQN